MLIALMWVVLSAALTVLLVAAIDIKNHRTCKDVRIVITGAKDFLFLNKHDILQLISQQGIEQPVGRSIKAFDLQQLEAALKRNVWIKEAKLFFDNNLVLHVSVFEREPVARVFDAEGNSFYIDSSGFKIPLGLRRIGRLPVFTGYPSEGAPQAADSQLLREMQAIGRFILQDSFWMAQIAQIDVTARQTYEMVPTVGNHLIEFGNGDHYENKFSRLFRFYKQVLGKYGFDRYSKISVQYDGQIVGTRRGVVSRVDSVQALKRIRSFMDEVSALASDSLQADAGVPVTGRQQPDTAALVREPVEPVRPERKPVKPRPVKPVVVQKLRSVNPGPRATKPRVLSSGNTPKAVMRPLNR